MSVEILPEHDLIEAARDGDHRAFEELYARYRERITAFIRSRVRDQGRAEDIAQEVFISALRRLRASSQEIAFRPWIYEIAKNACIDEYRRSRRGREVPLDDGGEDGGVGLLSTAPGPPAAIEAKERLSDLRGAFGVLSENHHQLIVMREFEGRSYDEIAERTGMSRQMVESALFRARRKLTEEYEELASGRRCVQIQAAIESGRARSARSLGVREKRRFARHLAHCQPCRLHAQLAQVDGSLLVTRSGVGAKIAALLPFPLLRWPWSGRRARSALAGVGSQPATLRTLHSASEPAAATSLGGAAVAAAVLALAGTGAVLAPGVSRGQGTAPIAAHAAAAATPARPQPARITAPAGPVTPVPRAAPRGRLQLRHPATQPGRTSTGVRRPAAPNRRHARASATASSGGPAAPGGGATRRTGLPPWPAAMPSAGAVVRSSGDTLSNTISGASTAVSNVTSSLPVSGAVSDLGATLAANTRSTTDALAGSTDAATNTAAQASSATGAAAAAAGSAAAGTLGGAAGVVNGVAHGLTGP
ncbi:MAG TPA: sigma-70 family RNA polymerase sigma factor [Solirubrobacteraceae bacterium]|nr:sigma-70 family RNA polymerase sigma factor [Solirubrobacteraceae bacterium]